MKETINVRVKMKAVMKQQRKTMSTQSKTNIFKKQLN